MAYPWYIHGTFCLQVLFMSGGCDSFNMLMPWGKCTKKNRMDLFDEYTKERGDVAINKTGMIRLKSFNSSFVSTPRGSQPCEKFGVHASLPLVAELYKEGQAAFVANIGSLLEPVTRSLFEDGSVQLPPNIFAHDVATMAAQSLHAQVGALDTCIVRIYVIHIHRLSTLLLTLQDPTSKGVLGRMLDAVGDKFSTSAFSIDGNAKIIEAESVAPDVLDAKRGAVRFEPARRSRDSQLCEGMDDILRNASNR